MLNQNSGKFLINRMIFSGCLYATPDHHINPTYRNLFHSYLRQVFSGIRIAQHI